LLTKVFIVTASFFLDASVPTQVRTSLFDAIGYGMFGLPPFLVALSFLLFKVKSSIGKPHVPFGLGIMLASFISMTQGGFVGESIWETVAHFIGAGGTLALFLGVFFIGIIALLNTSLDRLMNVVLLSVQKTLDGLVQYFERMVTSPGKAGPVTGKQQLMIKGMDTTAQKPVLKDIKINEAVVSKPAASTQKTTKNESGDKSEKREKSELKINPAMINQPSDGVMWQYPPLTLLSDGPGHKADRGDVRKNAAIIEGTLSSFGIKADVTEVNTGPAVTQYAIKIAHLRILVH
jgi:S-DNA-T family DNA segregation ATPase FtsK/SpoIIIE